MIQGNIKYQIKILTATALLLMTTMVSRGQHIDRTARKQLFDDNWKFFFGDTTSAKLKNFNDKAWRTLDLPHDWSIEGKIAQKNVTGGAGGYFPAGIGWYRKTFSVPAEWKNKKVSIYFEGVYMNAEVFINGRSLGTYPYGYTSFNYDLSPYLQPGKTNVIAVRVDNSQHLNSRWYSGSGIYRHVWMIATADVHIANWGVAVTTPVVSSKKASVQIKTIIKNETGLPQSIVLSTRLKDKNLRDAGSSSTKVNLLANSEKEVAQQIDVTAPLLWTPENPALYSADVRVLQSNKVVDKTKTGFGIRSIKFSVENGFQLNGKTVKLNGGCVHHDNGSLGAVAFDRAEEKKVELLKSAGFNAVRTSHNPPSEAFLNACDRLGLLVVDESFDCWEVGKNKQDYARYFNQWWKRDLDAMILRDRNHPSIIMWSTGNEIVERGTPGSVETAKMLSDEIKTIDTSRPVTSAIVENGKDWSTLDSLFAAHDIAGYNYHLGAAPVDHGRVPSRIIFQTESYPKDAFANWKLVKNNSYVIGDFVWTAMDYLGESGIGRWYYTGDVPGEHWEHDLFPWHGAYCGDIDLIGWRKPISHYRNLLYNNTEKLYMAVQQPEQNPAEIKTTWWAVWPTWDSWTWPEYAGKTMNVEVYSKYPGVRLYLNNKLIAGKATTETEEFKAIFTVPYSPGLLKAVGVENGREMESTILQTAGGATKTRVTVDRKTVTANGQDLCYVNVEVTDKDGTLQPNAANRLLFKIEGPGIIAGIANADMKDTDPYVGNTHKAWHGRAAVVIRSKHVAGDIKLTVSSPGLSTSVLNIKALTAKER